jgi:hypothetical protein
MQKGITYIVRPAMLPWNKERNLRRISPGSAQLFVGPASSRRAEQINVRSSTRATSLGCERARKQPGRFTGSSRINVPLATIWSQSDRDSSSVPSHQWTCSGRQSCLISSTHARSFAWLVGFVDSS